MTICTHHCAILLNNLVGVNSVQYVCFVEYNPFSNGLNRRIIIIITFLFTQGMPKQLKTGFHWGPACVNIKIEYREYGNPRGNSLPAPQFRGNQVYKLRRSAQENQFLMTVLSRNACIIALTLSDERFTKFNFERT